MSVFDKPANQIASDILSGKKTLNESDKKNMQKFYIKGQLDDLSDAIDDSNMEWIEDSYKKLNAQVLEYFGY